MPATYTPVRYPGGKTKLYPIVSRLIVANEFENVTYAEAFAGGAGLAIKLLLKGEVSRIYINDIDRAVFCMWDAIVNHSEELCKFVDSATFSIEEWESHREIYRNMEQASNLQLGKSAFYLNRTNVSGILKGGVIGGIGQAGKYKMDARFPKDTLKGKIRSIADRKSAIRLFNMDAEVFISEVLQHEDDVFAYFDPPYVKKGPGLYRDHFDESKHRSLAKCITGCTFPWIATYDESALIKELYSGYIAGNIQIKYTANQISDAFEVFISSSEVTIPKDIAELRMLELSESVLM